MIDGQLANNLDNISTQLASQHITQPGRSCDTDI